MMRERERADADREESVGEPGGIRRDIHRFTRSARLAQFRRAFGFDADHAGLGRESLDGCGNAGREAATADLHDHGADLRQILADLEAAAPGRAVVRAMPNTAQLVMDLIAAEMVVGDVGFGYRIRLQSKLLNMSVNEIELSVRAANCLNNANITTVGELAMKTEQEMLKYRNFGKKSLNEIKEKLEALGLSLGMKFDERLLENKKEA